MANEIHIKINNPTSDDAAVVNAYNTLMSTLRALPGGRRVDAGGTIIGGQRQFGDEIDVSKTRRAHGDIF